jgi:hypothetical protein
LSSSTVSDGSVEVVPQTDGLRDGQPGVEVIGALTREEVHDDPRR